MSCDSNKIIWNFEFVLCTQDVNTLYSWKKFREFKDSGNK